MFIRSRFGLTLIEVLLSLSLLGIVIATMFSIYHFNLVNWEREQETMDVQDNLRWGLDCMAREVRQAASLHSGSGVNRLKFDTVDDRIVEYTLEGTTLYRKSGSGVKQPVADHVTRLTVQCDSRGLVDITLSGQTENTAEITYHTAAAIRRVICNNNQSNKSFIECD